MIAFRYTLIFAVVVIAAFQNGFAQVNSTDRTPIPKYQPQKLAESAIRLKYKNQYAQRNAASQLELAHKLREEAVDLTSNPKGEGDLAMRFVLLREARELAVDGGDFHLALLCVDDISRDFNTNAIEMKMSALAVGFDKADLSTSQLADAYLRVVDDFIDALDPDSAHRTMTLVNDCQHKNHDNMLRLRAAAYDKRISDLRRELSETVIAARKLAKDSENPALNQMVGRYLFIVGRWNEAFPILRKGTNPQLRELAVREVAKPTDTAAMLQLADAWWGGEDSKSVRLAALRRRAAFWYRKVLPQVPTEKQAELRRRIAECESA